MTFQLFFHTQLYIQENILDIIIYNATSFLVLEDMCLLHGYGNSLIRDLSDMEQCMVWNWRLRA